MQHFLLFLAAGFESSVDPLLVAAIRNQKPEQGEDQYVLSCLLMVFIAVIIPRRAALINSTFDANKQGHVNNTHCMGMYSITAPHCTCPTIGTYGCHCIVDTELIQLG